MNKEEIELEISKNNLEIIKNNRRLSSLRMVLLFPFSLGFILFGLALAIDDREGAIKRHIFSIEFLALMLIVWLMTQPTKISR